jgi:hypothetical protein
MKEQSRQKEPFRPRNLIIGCIGIFFIATWIYLFLQFIDSRLFPANLYEYSRWVTAHDRSKIAVLVRRYAFDMNFALFIVDPSSPRIPDDLDQAIWISKDYEPTTYRNWHEELEWSGDSTVVAVIIEGEYVYAYDFTTGQGLEQSEAIKKLLKARDLPHHEPPRD